MIMPNSGNIALPGRTIHFLEWGAKNAPPLVFLHGVRDHAYSWAPIAQNYASTHHVFAFDLRGHGDSDWCNAYNLHDYMRDLAGVVDALQLSPFALVAHSLGGHISLRYAACFPEHVSRLCLIEGLEIPIEPQSYPWCLRDWADRETAREKRTPRVYASALEAAARIREEHPRFDENTLELIVRHGLREVSNGYVWKYDNACRNLAPQDPYCLAIGQLIEAVRCPVLLAYGKASWMAPPSVQALSKLADYRLIIYPDAGHWVQHDSRAPFEAALESFLSPSP